jgi:uncharacterized protein YdeI (YjbR/CyaY-like superfamily)
MANRHPRVDDYIEKSAEFARPILKIPEYFSAALKKNPKARATFEDFSPTNHGEYVQWVGEAKRDQTREQRLKVSISRLAEGKPRNWKYMPAWG